MTPLARWISTGTPPRDVAQTMSDLLDHERLAVIRLDDVTNTTLGRQIEAEARKQLQARKR